MTDPVLWNDWHAVADLTGMADGETVATTLLDTAIVVTRSGAGVTIARGDGETVRADARYGFAWACLGEPRLPIVAIPEAEEDDRWVISSGSFYVKSSGPRIVENFLDMGHFPFVHAGWLGAEPHTEIAPYDVAPLPEDGLIATGCKIEQPVSSPAARGSDMVHYVYKVERPLTVCLFKTNAVEHTRNDVVYHFVQPIGAERCLVHQLMAFLRHGTSVASLRRFQQLIFLQDKPILENQVPLSLPLGPRAELPVLADKSSVTYRRWLARIGLTYGTIPADAEAVA